MKLTYKSTFALTAVVLLALGCSDDDSRTAPATACERSSDCRDPDARCVAGRCATECGDDRDCETGDACVNGLCTAANPCRMDTECSFDQECVGGICAPIPGYCERNRDCPPGTACSADTRRCIEDGTGGTCNDDGDCFAGEVCESGFCELEGSLSCELTSDCEDGEVCRNNRCVIDCVEDRDCANGTICVEGRCEREEDNNGNNGPATCTEDPSLCTDSQECCEGTCVSQGDCDDNNQPSCTVDPDVCTAAQECCEGQCVVRGQCGANNGTGGDYWEVCEAASECETELCLGGLDGMGHCTEVCANRAACPQQPIESLCIQAYHLITQQTGGNALVGLCYADDTGALCNPASTNNCFDGICVDRRPGAAPEGLCSIRCQSASDCRTGWACGPKEFNVAGEPQLIDVCVPIGESCAGTGIEAANQCYSSFCVTEENDVGRCTTLCSSSADCPGGWSCVDVEDTGICWQ